MDTMLKTHPDGHQEGFLALNLKSFLFDEDTIFR
jgi:hypothetical protein